MFITNICQGNNVHHENFFMIGNRIKQLRERKNLTLQGFAEKIGSSHGYISRLERGIEKNPSVTLIIAICTVFGINQEWLEHGKGNMFTENNPTKW